VKSILLTYALSEGPRVQIIKRFRSTSNAIAYAIKLGAVVATARIDDGKRKDLQ